ncbi:hypothetical protein AgCh_016500 [Apium graveolens]
MLIIRSPYMTLTCQPATPLILVVMGLILLTIQAYSDNLQPDACGAEKSSCIIGVDALMFYVSLCLMALGAGGLKGSLPALGADQFDAKDPKGAQSLASSIPKELIPCTGKAFLPHPTPCQQPYHQDFSSNSSCN